MMRIKGKLALLGGMLLSFAGAAAPRPTILAQVMPWYEAEPAQRSWGWHWTMNQFDPNRVDGQARRAIASHLYPAIGPYDSLNPAVLEYQALTMKVGGVDGAIIDWYGTDAINDYPGIHRRTLALIAALKQHGLKLAICSEDRAVEAAAGRAELAPEQALAGAAGHLEFFPCAFPRFYDIDAEAQTQPSYGVLDDRAGATFRRTLDGALGLNGPIIQVGTWNDYGEGTVVEPTRERGFRDLLVIQEARRRLDGGRFPFRAADLPLPRAISDLRTADPAPASPGRREHLDAATHALTDSPTIVTNSRHLGVGPRHPIATASRGAGMSRVREPEWD